MAKTAHLDFGPLGFEGQWADLFDPAFMSQRRFEEAVKTMREATGDTKAAEDFLRGRISAWHVLDADSGDPLGEPQTADLNGLPLGITKAISEKVTELFEAVVPNGSRNR